MVETCEDWHEMLQFSLHGYCTSVCTSTGETSFSLVYSMNAILPIEVEIPFLRILTDVKLDEVEWIQARLDQLNLIDEKPSSHFPWSVISKAVKESIRREGSSQKPRGWKHGVKKDYVDSYNPQGK